ncbi:2793_t:CDS:2 [Diversispora eburnea]|uniref:2793_t:CDS:1 n=1 Tax=Diversispora eburnea TaxID=1213867 RepID=A0A9N9B3Y0_9GLOM|nr:2793_t:CDS:2 [Diversispora eburnea]
MSNIKNLINSQKFSATNNNNNKKVKEQYSLEFYFNKQNNNVNNVESVVAFATKTTKTENDILGFEVHKKEDLEDLEDYRDFEENIILLRINGSFLRETSVENHWLDVLEWKE